jgi:hypothetical protein
MNFQESIRERLTLDYPISLNTVSTIFQRILNGNHCRRIADVLQKHRRRSEPDIRKTAAK